MDYSLGRDISKATVLHKFGWNPSIADAGTEEVWDGSAAYSYPTTALMTRISQTTDQAAMRGATIEVQGLDINWALVTQNATLNASNTTTAVVLTTALLRVFRMRVLANVVGDQDIRVHNTAENQDYAIITAGNNRSLMAIYTVPADKELHLSYYYGDAIETTAGGKPDVIEFKLWIADRENGYEFELVHANGLPKLEKAAQFEFSPPSKIPAKHDIKITASPSAAAAIVHAGFGGYLFDA